MGSLLNRGLYCCVICVVAILSGCASGPTIETARHWKIPENINLVNGELENGFSYSIYNSEKLPKDFADLRLIVNVGSNDESETEYGYAHLVEHLVFRNTKAYPNGELNVLLNRMGATLGHDFNAFTSSNYTLYTLRIPTDNSENLEKTIQILDELAAHAEIKKPDVEVEKKIVLQEKLMRLSENNSVDKKVKRKITEILDENYHLPIGSVDSISKSTVSSLQSFYNKWYKANNMHLVIVGNFNDDQLVKNILSSFGNNTQATHGSIKNNAVKLESLQNKTFYSSSSGEDRSQDLVSVLMMKPKKNIIKFTDLEPQLAEGLALEIFLAKLNLKSRQQNLPLSFTADGPGYSPDLAITRLVGFVSNGNYLDLLKIYNSVTQNMLQNGISEDEFLEFRKNFADQFGNQWYQFDALKSNQIANIITSNITEAEKPLLVSGSYYNVAIDLVKEIKLEQVNHAFKLMSEYPKIVSIEANNERSSARPDISDVKTIVENTLVTDLNLNVSGTVKNLNSTYEKISQTSSNKKKIRSISKDSVIDVNTLELANGYKLYHKKTDVDSGQYHIELVSPTGMLHSPDRQTLENAYIASQLINIHKLGAFLGREYSEKLNYNGSSSLLSYMDNYSHGLSFEAKKAYADYYFKLIKHLWTQPLNISDDWFNEMMFSLRQDMAEYRSTTANEYYTKTYTQLYSGHPGVWIPSDKAYEAFQLNDFKQTVNSLFVTNDFYIVVVGDISEKHVKKLAENYLSDLPAYQFKSDEQVALRISKPTQNHSINVPGSNEAKTFMELIYINDKRYDREKRVSVHVAREILYNRIQTILREEKGLIYSLDMNSDLIHYEDTSNLTKISLTTSLENKKQVETIIDKEISTLMSGDIAQSEIDRAKQVVKQNALEWITTNQGWVRIFSGSLLDTDNLAKSYYYLNPDSMLAPIKVTDVINAFRGLFEKTVKIKAAYDPI